MHPAYSSPIITNKKFFFSLTLSITILSALGYSQTVTWEQKNKGLNGRAVFSLASGTHGEVYAGSWADEIFKSTDDGLNWKQVTFGKNAPAGNQSGVNKILSIIVDNKGKVFAAGESGVIYASTDQGAAWTTTKTMFDHVRIRAIAKDSAGDLFAAAENKGIIRSTDDGLSWAVSSPFMNVTALAVNSNNELFAASQSQGIYHSEDTGKTWTFMNLGLPNGEIEAFYVNQNGDCIAGGQQGIYKLRSGEKKWGVRLSYRYAKAFTRSGTDIIAMSISAGSFYQSPDDGETWSEFNAKDLGAVWMNAIVTTTSDHLLVGTEVYGVYRSTDNARHWRETNAGLTNPYVVMACQLDKRTLIAGLRMGGIFLSTDDGESWFHRSFSWQNISAVASSPSGYTYALVDQTHARFQRSDDNGETWSFFEEGLPECQLSSLLIDKKGDIFLSTNGYGIFFSEDNAEHWTDRNRGLTDMDVQKIIFTKKNSMIAITSGGIFRSEDYGKQWYPSTLREIQVLSVAESVRGPLFAGTNGDGIYRSNDDGKTWTKTGFPSVTVTRLGEAAGTLYAMTFGEGPYKSRDGGKTWNPIDAGWPATQITAFITDSKGNLLLGTYGLGMVKIHFAK